MAKEEPTRKVRVIVYSEPRNNGFDTCEGAVLRSTAFPKDLGYTFLEPGKYHIGKALPPISQKPGQETPAPRIVYVEITESEEDDMNRRINNATKQGTIISSDNFPAAALLEKIVIELNEKASQEKEPKKAS